PWITTVPVCGPVGVVPVVVVVGVVVGATVLELPPPQAANVSINRIPALIALHRITRRCFRFLFPAGSESSKPKAAAKDPSIQFQLGLGGNGAAGSCSLEKAVLLMVTVALGPADSVLGETAHETLVSADGTEQVIVTVPLKPLLPATETFSVPELVRVNE